MGNEATHALGHIEDSDIPTGWKRRSFAEVAEVASGQVDPQEAPYRSWPLLAPNHIQSRTGQLLGRIESAEEQDAISGKYEVRPGDVVYSKIRPYLRKAWLADRRLLCSADMYPLRPSEDVDPRYLAAVVLSSGFSRYAERVSARTGIPKINRRGLARYGFALPPISEQREIAAILSSVDDAIAATRDVIDQTKRVKKGLLQTLMTRGIGHTRFKNTEIGEIPEQWEMVRLEDVTTAKGSYGAGASKRPFSPDLPRYIRITDINDDGSLNDEAPVSISESEAEGNIVEEGDVVFARTGATVGKTYLVRGDEGQAAYAGYLIKFHPVESRLHPRYLEAYTHSPRYWSWVEDTARTTAQPNINATEYGNMPLPLPSVEEQESIANVLSRVERSRAFSLKNVDRLQQLKRGLMQDLLTGRVRVQPD